MLHKKKTEAWDAEDDLPVADWWQSFSEKEFEVKESDLSSWFEGTTEEPEQMLKDEETANRLS